jgi:hypothetical protein
VSGGTFNRDTNSCEATVVLTVTGGPVTGHFRVKNAGYDDSGYPTETLSSGTQTRHVSFGGFNPGEKNHEVWFISNAGTTGPVGGSCNGFPYPN